MCKKNIGILVEEVKKVKWELNVIEKEREEEGEEEEEEEEEYLGGPTTPSMITWATCTPRGWNSLARHCDNALNANFPQPVVVSFRKKKKKKLKNMHKFMIHTHITSLLTARNQI